MRNRSTEKTRPGSEADSAGGRFPGLRGGGMLMDGEDGGRARRALLETKARTVARAGARHGAGELALRQKDYGTARARFAESLAIFQELGESRGIADSLYGLGMTTLSQWDFRAARAFFEESLAFYRELGDKGEIVWALYHLGIAAHYQVDYGASAAYFEECLALFRELGDQNDIAWSLNRRGRVARDQGEHGTAPVILEESLALFRALGVKRGISRSLNDLGIAALAQGDLGAARALFEESLALSRPEGTRLANRVAVSFGGLACVAYSHGNYRAARSHWVESLAIHREGGSKGGIARVLEGLAAVAVAQAEAGRAARLFGAAAGLRQAMGAPLPPAERAQHGRYVAAARAVLGEAAFVVAWAEGRSATLEDAIASALEGASPCEAADGDGSTDPVPLPGSPAAP